MEARPFQPQVVANDIHVLRSDLLVPGMGSLPVNAFVLKSSQPVLVDTGLAGLTDSFLSALRSVVPPEEIRWIWLTHTDPDHVGNLREVLDLAPQARMVTSFVGMAKLQLLGLPTDRAYLLNAGQSLDVGDRSLLAVAPPTFDAPETTGLFDPKTRTLVSADCFGALLGGPAETAAEIAPNDLRDGVLTWSAVDAPWLQRIDAGAFGRSLQSVRDLDAGTVLSSHLPPATGMVETLLRHLADAPTARPFVGPDQAALEKMMMEMAAGAETSA